MSRAVLSLGSNMGDRKAQLNTAVHSLGREVRAVSSIYRTPPWGGVEQDDFYNIVVIVEDAGIDANGWWTRCQAMEVTAGRERLVRWGPRTLDADVITVDSHGHTIISDDPMLILPHPRAAQRAFVLLPWSELDPTAELAGAGPIADLLEELDLSGISKVGHVR
ncbi:MAG: 2-amino-4-hydroxy-6-hydroxymethyldihydropteridine diphosphokinase [Nakamurella sp.]